MLSSGHMFRDSAASGNLSTHEVSETIFYNLALDADFPPSSWHNSCAHPTALLKEPPASADARFSSLICLKKHITDITGIPK
jgi:hypothetical protein